MPAITDLNTFSCRGVVWFDWGGKEGDLPGCGLQWRGGTPEAAKRGQFKGHPLEAAKRGQFKGHPIEDAKRGQFKGHPIEAV